jgi:hypothetical protein
MLEDTKKGYSRSSEEPEPMLGSNTSQESTASSVYQKLRKMDEFIPLLPQWL